MFLSSLQTWENWTEQKYLLSTYLNANGGAATAILSARDVFAFQREYNADKVHS